VAEVHADIKNTLWRLLAVAFYVVNGYLFLPVINRIHLNLLALCQQKHFFRAA